MFNAWAAHFHNDPTCALWLQYVSSISVSLKRRTLEFQRLYFVIMPNWLCCSVYLNIRVTPISLSKHVVARPSLCCFGTQIILSFQHPNTRICLLPENSTCQLSTYPLLHDRININTNMFIPVAYSKIIRFSGLVFDLLPSGARLLRLHKRQEMSVLCSLADDDE
jgi:hypothetical protein